LPIAAKNCPEGRLPYHPRQQKNFMRLNNQQFLTVVGVIIMALIAYLGHERFRERQDFWRITLLFRLQALICHSGRARAEGQGK
jgi:cell division protein FtsW (lipid II flippase)